MADEKAKQNEGNTGSTSSRSRSSAAGWRKVEVAAPEGASEDHAAYEYQFGGEVDGVFIPAVTKSGGYIDALVANAKASADAENGD